MYKLGIDVGGTNTDAVLIDENLNVAAAIKNPTSGDIYEGIMGAVDAVLAESGVDAVSICTRTDMHCSMASPPPKPGSTSFWRSPWP